MRWKSGLVVFVAIAGLYACVDDRLHRANVNTNVTVAANPLNMPLNLSPIRKDWILSGHPTATSALVAETEDGMAQILVWHTTAGRFNWFYHCDETITVLDGEMFVTDGANAESENARERHLGPGDIAFFHEGSVVTWRVPDHVRKIATVKHVLPGPLASAVRWIKAAAKLWAYPAPPVALL